MSLEDKIAACSSNRGIALSCFLNGANLLFPKLKLQYMTPDLDTPRYETTA